MDNEDLGRYVLGGCGLSVVLWSCLGAFLGVVAVLRVIASVFSSRGAW